jgi:hypothetical protein
LTGVVAPQFQEGELLMAKRARTKPAKTVAGLRIPETLRNAVDSLVSSPLGREILADALIAAAAAAAAALVKRPPTARQVASAGEAVSETGARAVSGAKNLTEAAAGAVGQFVTDAVSSMLPTSVTSADDTKSEAGSRRGKTRRSTGQKSEAASRGASSGRTKGERTGRG